MSLPEWELPSPREREQRLHLALYNETVENVWLRRLTSFAEEERADREFWRSMSGEQRVAALDDLRRQWNEEHHHAEHIEGLRRTVRIVRSP